MFSVTVQGHVDCVRLFQFGFDVQTQVCVFTFSILDKKCHRLKPTKAISICVYSVLCRGYISAMFAFVAMATDVRPSQITSGTQ